MQTHNSQQFQRVLQNPLVTLPIFMCLLRAAHSRFNQVKSLFGVRKSLLTLSQFYRVCPPMDSRRRGQSTGRMGLSREDRVVNPHDRVQGRVVETTAHSGARRARRGGGGAGSRTRRVWARWTGAGARWAVAAA